jgi:energy-coupling factor transporter transmembrane protein EcfT
MNNDTLNKQEVIKFLGSNYFKILGIIFSISGLAFVLSPFLLIWLGWSIFWKVGLSGVIGISFAIFAKIFIRNYISNSIDEILTKRNKKNNYKLSLKKKMEKFMVQKENKKK